jgi:peptidoglycan/LPS O-acetylase OafA/YrhL
VGDASYSLYLIHIYVVLVIEIVFFRFIGIESAAGAVVFVVTGAAAAIGCAIVIYSCLECHITHRLSSRRDS